VIDLETKLEAYKVQQDGKPVMAIAHLLDRSNSIIAMTLKAKDKFKGCVSLKAMKLTKI
jgi:hypothetical protein